MDLIFLTYLTFINFIAAVAYGYDKAQAGMHGRRVPERTLLLLALAGGTLGAFVAMQLFHHKTRKREFQLKFWGVVALQAAGLVFAYLSWLRA